MGKAAPVSLTLNPGYGSVLAGRAADIDARISVQASVAADLDRRIAQIDSAVEKATDRGRTVVAMKLADEQRKARGDLAGQRIREAKTLADLKVEKANIDGERRIVEADLGPVKYLAILVGADSETALRWFVLMVALLPD